LDVPRISDGERGPPKGRIPTNRHQHPRKTGSTVREVGMCRPPRTSGHCRGPWAQMRCGSCRRCSTAGAYRLRSFLAKEITRRGATQGAVLDCPSSIWAKQSRLLRHVFLLAGATIPKCNQPVLIIAALPQRVLSDGSSTDKLFGRDEMSWVWCV